MSDLSSRDSGLFQGLSKNEILALSHCSSVFPKNLREFLDELKTAPPHTPNRAEIQKALNESFLKLKGQGLKIGVISVFENEFPKNLKATPDPPVALFYRGDLSILNKNCFSIVGTRNATQEGISKIHSICKNIHRNQTVICSGIARGIDKKVHEIAIQNQIKTISILPNGFGAPCSNINQSLENLIIQNGGLVLSEFSPFSRTRKAHFEFRNRLIAGLGEFLIIIEAPHRSGTLITARHCERYGRSIFVPWLSSENPNSAGLHRIIQNFPNASLYRSIRAVIDANLNPQRPPLNLLPTLEQISENSLEILKILTRQPLNFDGLKTLIKWKDPVIKSSLLELLSLGLIHEQSGDWYFVAD